MNDNDIKYEFIGFEPNERQKNSAHLTMERLKWESPSDSSLRVTIVRTRSVFQVNCRISSSVGIFVADGSSEHFKAAKK